jgi:hypothetical protein
MDSMSDGGDDPAISSGVNCSYRLIPCIGASQGNFTHPLNDRGTQENKEYICFMLIRSAVFLATFGTTFQLKPTCNFEENPTQTKNIMSKLPSSHLENNRVLMQ